MMVIFELAALPTAPSVSKPLRDELSHNKEIKWAQRVIPHNVWATKFPSSLMPGSLSRYLWSSAFLRPDNFIAISWRLYRHAKFSKKCIGKEILPQNVLPLNSREGNDRHMWISEYWLKRRRSSDRQLPLLATSDRRCWRRAVADDNRRRHGS